MRLWAFLELNILHQGEVLTITFLHLQYYLQIESFFTRGSGNTDM